MDVIKDIMDSKLTSFKTYKHGNTRTMNMSIKCSINLKFYIRKKTFN